MAALRVSQHIHMNTLTCKKEKKKLYLQKNKKHTTLILAKLVICGWFHSTPQKPEPN